jgi:hypothetical protein
MAAEQANNHRPKEIVCAPSRKNMTEGKASMQDMMDNQVPIHVRDDCAGVLIPLNQYVSTLHCIAAMFNRWLSLLSCFATGAEGKTCICPCFVNTSAIAMKYVCIRNTSSERKSRSKEENKWGCL